MSLSEKLRAQDLMEQEQRKQQQRGRGPIMDSDHSAISGNNNRSSSRGGGGGESVKSGWSWAESSSRGSSILRGNGMRKMGTRGSEGGNDANNNKLAVLKKMGKRNMKLAYGLKQKALTEFHSARGSRQFFGEASYKTPITRSWFKMNRNGWNSSNMIRITNMPSIHAAFWGRWQPSYANAGHTKNAAMFWIWRRKFWGFSKNNLMRLEPRWRKRTAAIRWST